MSKTPRSDISSQLGWAYLRAGRQLKSLPTTKALFRAGKLSWSKVRCITSVADVGTENVGALGQGNGCTVEIDQVPDVYAFG